MAGIERETGSRRLRRFGRGAAAGVGVATMAVMLATPAGAAQPNHRACLGEDVRSYAEGGSAFGGFVSGVLAVDGAGSEIQAHLAGAIPDEMIPNRCND
jgi:hypothetical protein